MRLGRRASAIALAVGLTGCGLSTTTTDPRGGAPGERRAEASRTLVMVARAEPDTIAAKEVLRVTGLSFSSTPRLFNAGLAILDGREVPLPYLVDAHPQLNTDTWRVLPDGRMETIYRLRPNLRWHDGAALSADDCIYTSATDGRFAGELRVNASAQSEAEMAIMASGWRVVFWMKYSPSS